MKNIYTSGEKLKQIRTENHLTQKEFANKLGISTPYLSELENGKKEITTKIIISLKENFNISSDWFIFSNSEKYSLNDNPNDNLNDNLNASYNISNALEERIHSIEYSNQLAVFERIAYIDGLLPYICAALKVHTNKIFTKNEVEDLKIIKKLSMLPFKKLLSNNTAFSENELNMGKNSINKSRRFTRKIYR